MPRISINGSKWLIKLSSQSELQSIYLSRNGQRPGSELEAICDHVGKRILVCETLSSDQRKSALIHELIHVFLPELSERKVLRLEKLIAIAGSIV
jgi:hypothetical protein